mgnify:FL=1
MKLPAHSPAQIVYLGAKALYETARDAVAKETAETLGDVEAETDEEIDALAEQMGAIDARHGLSKATTELLAAEKALLAWGFQKARSLAPPEKVGEIDSLAAAARVTPSVRRKCLDLFLQLAK